MREKITFAPGVTIQTQLDQASAREVQSRTGTTEYMRVCDGDQRIMFAPAALEQAITESGATEGDLIAITPRGRGRAIRWEVAIIGEPAQPIQRATPPAAIERATRPAATPPPPAPAQPAPAVAEAARAVTADAAEMTAAYVAAIEATGAAEAYATRAGIRDLSLTDADTVTRVALAIYIQRAKAGR